MQGIQLPHHADGMEGAEGRRAPSHSSRLYIRLKALGGGLALKKYITGCAPRSFVMRSDIGWKSFVLDKDFLYKANEFSLLFCV
jgi:hypothetical protein